MKIVSTGNKGLRSETFTVEAGKTYRFQGWFYTGAGAGTISVYGYNGNSSSYTLINPTVTPNTWSSFSFDKTMDIGGSICRIMIYITDAGALYIDDINVFDLTRPILKGGTLEGGAFK